MNKHLLVYAICACLVNTTNAYELARPNKTFQSNTTQADPETKITLNQATDVIYFDKNAGINTTSTADFQSKRKKTTKFGSGKSSIKMLWAKMKLWEDCTFRPNLSFIIPFFIVMPTFAVLGLVGNAICLRVIVTKFSSETAFLYQILLIASDSVAILLRVIDTVIKRWGYGTGSDLRFRGCTPIPSIQTSSLIAYIDVYFSAPVSEWLLGLTPLLLLATAIDRIFGMAKPLFYKERFPQKKFLVGMAVLSVLLSSIGFVQRVAVNEVVSSDLIETVQGSNVTLYSRSFKSDHITLNRRLGITVVTLRLSTLIALLFVGLWVARLYSSINNNPVHAQNSQTNSSTTPQLLTKLVLVQFAVVAIGFMPYLTLQLSNAISSVVFHRWLAAKLNLFVLQDLSYMFCTSANVYCYAAVCKRFRLAVLDTVCCKTAVEPIGDTPNAVQGHAVKTPVWLGPEMQNDQAVVQLNSIKS